MSWPRSRRPPLVPRLHLNSEKFQRSLLNQLRKSNSFFFSCLHLCFSLRTISRSYLFSMISLLLVSPTNFYQLRPLLPPLSPLLGQSFFVLFILVSSTSTTSSSSTTTSTTTPSTQSWTPPLVPPPSRVPTLAEFELWKSQSQDFGWFDLVFITDFSILGPPGNYASELPFPSAAAPQ